MRLGLLAGVACAALGVCATAGAQTAPTTAPTTLGEVIVTATRRSESALSVPYNITAISGGELSRDGVTDLASLRNAVPGLTAADYGVRGASVNNNFVIRGVNTNDVGVGESEFPNLAGSTVSNYIDETPLFVNLKLTDIARVEVLKGPQGTLFGADSEGGTVRTIHNKPDPAKLDGYIDATGSGTDRADQPNYDVDLMLNLPLAPRLAFRMNGGYDREAGFINADNAVVYNHDAAFLPYNAQPLLVDPTDPVHSRAVTTHLHDINSSDVWYARGALLWKPISSLTAELTYQHQDDEADGFDFESPGADYVTHRRIPVNPSVTKTDIGALTLTEDFGFATVTSASSYYNVDTRDMYDNSGIDVEYPYYYGAYPRITTPNYDFNRDDALTQELRLVSAKGQMFDYVVGGFYEDRRTRAYSIETVPGFAAWSHLPGTGTDGFNNTFAGQIVEYYGGTRPGTLTPADLTYDFDRQVQFTDTAAFGELTWHATGKLNVTGGFRVFEEDFRQTTVQHIYNAGTTFGSDSLGTSAGTGGKHSQDQIFKANVAYDVAPRMLAYFTFSQGYRAGGANAYPVGTCGFCNDASFVTFNPDRANNYELGLKGVHGPLSFTADVYDIDWTDIQLEVSATSGTPIIVNGGAARSYGSELQGQYKATPDLTLSAGYAYTHATLTQTFSLDGGLYTGTDGTWLPGVSRHQANFAVDYTPLVFAARRLDLHLDGSYRSEFHNEIEDDAAFRHLTGFSMFNAYVQGEVAPHTTLQLFARNLLNTKGVTAYSALTPGGPGYAQAHRFDPSEFVSRPLTVGLRVVYRR